MYLVSFEIYIKHLKIITNHNIHIKKPMPSSFYNPKFNPKKYLSPSKISNYVKHDKILDYLDVIDEHNMMLDENLVLTKKRKFSENVTVSNTNICDSKNICDDTTTTLKQPFLPTIQSLTKKTRTSLEYISNSGYEFETHIFNQIQHLMKTHNQHQQFVKINEIDYVKNCNQTLHIIQSNAHNCITNAVLINNSNTTWGKPDLIVRGDWILKYIISPPSTINKTKWYIIDIKSATINLIDKGNCLASKLAYNVYKSQIYIYTQALNNLLHTNGINNDVKHGFIMGKRYKYVVQKKTIWENTFDRLVTVDFKHEKKTGNNLKKLIVDAHRWHTYLRKNWNTLSVNPINDDNLYPNMKNTMSGNWHRVKKTIALKNKEITLLWNCGLANRDKAWKAGYKNFGQISHSSILGFGNTNKELIIDKMLECTNNKIPYQLDKSNNLMDWQTPATNEFFVDFETYNTDDFLDTGTNDCELDDFVPNVYSQKIYMCGIVSELENIVFVIKPEYNTTHNNGYKCMSSKYSDAQITWCDNERDLVQKIICYFKKYTVNNTRLIHWSFAEPSLFEKKLVQYNLRFEHQSNWYDLLKIFKNPISPVIIEGCFGFGLKEVVRSLNRIGEIQFVWSELDDGLLSSFLARDIYMGKNNDSEKFNIGEIIEYNLIDCQALKIIIQWMRKVIE